MKIAVAKPKNEKIVFIKPKKIKMKPIPSRVEWKIIFFNGGSKSETLASTGLANLGVKNILLKYALKINWNQYHQKLNEE